MTPVGGTRRREGRALCSGEGRARYSGEGRTLYNESDVPSKWGGTCPPRTRNALSPPVRGKQGAREGLEGRGEKDAKQAENGVWGARRPCENAETRRDR